MEAQIIFPEKLPVFLPAEIGQAWGQPPLNFYFLKKSLLVNSHNINNII
jgi:hypothetical protein